VKPSIFSVSPVVFPADLSRRSVTRSPASHHHSSLLDVRVCREHALMGWPDDSEETLGDGALEAADTPRYFDTGLEPPIARTQDTVCVFLLFNSRNMHQYQHYLQSRRPLWSSK
jgi:hypothetical protein